MPLNHWVFLTLLGMSLIGLVVAVIALSHNHMEGDR